MSALLLALLSSPLLTDDPLSVERVSQQVLELVCAALIGDEPEQERARERLNALGSKEAPAVVALVLNPPQALEDLDLANAALRCRELLLDTLERLPGDAVSAAVHAEITAAEGDDPLRACIAILGRTGSHEALDSMLECATRLEAPTRDGIRSEETIVEAFARVVRRDERATSRLVRRFPELPGRERALVVASLGSSATSEGLHALVEILARDPELALDALVEIERVTRQGLWLDENACSILRSSLDQRQDEELRYAILCLGHLGDAESFPRLIQLLDDPLERIRSSSLKSLQAISGVELPADPARWLARYESENRWHEIDLRRLRRELSSRDHSAVIRAIVELSQNSTFRNEIVYDLCPLLFHRDRRIVQAACSALAQIGTLRAAPCLLQLLSDDEDGRFAELGAEALRTLTGLDLPPTNDAWTAALGSLGQRDELEHR